MKRMRNIILFACLSLLLACSGLEPESIEPGDIFVKYYGTTKTEQLVGMERLSNGDFLILGSTNRFGSIDVVLIKTNSIGSKIWEQVYNTRNYEDDLDMTDLPSKIKIYNDPSLGEAAFVIGTSENATNQDSTKLEVFKIDIADGHIVDTMLYQFDDRRLVPNLMNKKATYGADLIYVDKGGVDDHFYLLGSTDTYGDQTNLADPKSILLKNVLASSFGDNPVAPNNAFDYSLFGFSGEDVGISLLRDTSSSNELEYYFLATITSDLSKSIGAGGKDISIVKFDPIGGNSEGNSKYYGTKGNDIPSNFIIDGSFIYVTGTTSDGSSERAFFLSVNKALSNDKEITLISGVQCEKDDDPCNVQLDAEGSKGFDLIKIKNEPHLYVLGTINNYSNGNLFKQDDLMLVKVNIEGLADVEDYTIYGSNGNDAGNAIIQEPNGSLIIGATIDFGGSATMLTMLKTNAKGEFSK